MSDSDARTEAVGRDSPYLHEGDCSGRVKISPDGRTMARRYRKGPGDGASIDVSGFSYERWGEWAREFPREDHDLPADPEAAFVARSLAESRAAAGSAGEEARGLRRENAALSRDRLLLAAGCLALVLLSSSLWAPRGTWEAVKLAYLVVMSFAAPVTTMVGGL